MQEIDGLSIVFQFMRFLPSSISQLCISDVPLVISNV